MANVTFKGAPITLDGVFPKLGQTIADFELAANDLSDVRLNDFKQPFLILNIFPSLDTGTCANSVRNFNNAAAAIPNCSVLCISKDLPFAQGRFCSTENIKNVKALSAFRNPAFAKQFGVDIVDGLIRGLLARAVIVLNSQREVIYTELVSEITDEPNYSKCLAALSSP
jgi:thiol peroxidase